MKFYKTEKGHYYKNLNSIKQRIGEAEYLKYKNSNAKKYQDIEFDEKRFRKIMVAGGKTGGHEKDFKISIKENGSADPFPIPFLFTDKSFISTINSRFSRN